MELNDQLIEQLGSKDQIKRYQANQAVGNLTTSADLAVRKQTAEKLADALVATRQERDKNAKPKKDQIEPPMITLPKFSDLVRNQVAGHLALVGGPEQVPALKEAAKNLETRELARFALDRIDCDAATAVLVDSAVNDIGVEFRTGVINALGHKTGPAVLEALKTCCTDSDAEIRTAAAGALANQPDPSADQAIASLLPKAHGRDRNTLIKARLRLAGTLASAGNKDAAKRIYQAIRADKPAPPQENAAKIGIEKLG